MGLPKVKQGIYAATDYFAIERFAEERHEFIDGAIIAMAGESIAHGDITMNISGSLFIQLKGKPCRVLTKDTKVCSGPSPRKPFTTAGLYSYPDVLVICGEPMYLDKNNDIVLNPTVIIEVLSPTTEEFDRGEKLKRYQLWNVTLKHCLLVSQDEPRIDLYNRNAEGGWTFESHNGLDDRVSLSAIDCVLNLADTYDRVVFAE